MAALDESPNEVATGVLRRWKHPRLLVLLSVLALGLSINAVVEAGYLTGKMNGSGTDSAGDWLGIFATEAGGESEASQLAEARSLDRRKACGRIQRIVETSCSLKQRDRDAEGIRICVAQELQYTMWSAYGCK